MSNGLPSTDGKYDSHVACVFIIELLLWKQERELCRKLYNVDIFKNQQEEC